jgi:hypothetical protein
MSKYKRTAPNIKIMNHTGPKLENDPVLIEPLDRIPFNSSKTPKTINNAPKNVLIDHSPPQG